MGKNLTKRQQQNAVAKQKLAEKRAAARQAKLDAGEPAYPLTLTFAPSPDPAGLRLFVARSEALEPAAPEQVAHLDAGTLAGQRLPLPPAPSLTALVLFSGFSGTRATRARG